MEFRLLGPLEVADDGAAVTLGGPKQRTVLAHLALQAGRAVVVERLIDALWGSAPPETARNTLQTYIKHLRKALGADRIGSSGPAYMLRADRDELDTLRFVDLVAEGGRLMATDPRAASETLGRALGLWRGPALDDLRDQPSLQPDVAHLEELRLGAVEAKIGAELEIGSAQRLVPELESVLAEHPYRERSWGYLMTALYREGRQGDALLAYQRAHRVLAEELGIDPSAELQYLHARILRQDPALHAARSALEPAPAIVRAPVAVNGNGGGSTSSVAALPASDLLGRQTTPAGGGERDARPRPSRAASRRSSSQRWRASAGLAVAVALVAAVVIPRLLGVDRPESVGSNTVALLGDDGLPGRRVELGRRPGASVAGLGSVWVAQPDRDAVVRLDPASGVVTDTIDVGDAPSALAVGAGSIWVANAGVGTVQRIDVSVGKVSATYPVGSSPMGIAYGNDAVWVADALRGSVVRLDPVSGDLDEAQLGGLPSAVAVTTDAVWAAVAPNSVARVDPGTMDVVVTQPVGSAPAAIAAAFGSIWVANRLDGTVSRLDPITGREEAKIAVGQGPTALAETTDGVWVANEFDASVVAIDPQTNTTRRTPLGAGPVSLAVDDSGLWVAIGAAAKEHRGGTLAVAGRDRPTSLDPSVAYDTAPWQLLSITNDGLLGYAKVGGPTGATLVPDLAAAMPAVSPDGRTYRFPLRAGLQYDDGTPVAPEDFRRAIERVMILSDARGLFSAVLGARACMPPEDGPSPVDCDLAEGITLEADAVTFHLSSPDPEFLFKLAMPFAFPVPAATPATDQGLSPLPATGPYRVSEWGPAGVQLVRNPTFVEGPAGAQPDGSVDAITWRFGIRPADAYDLLAAGDIDVMLDAPAEPDLAALSATHGDRIALSPGSETVYLALDLRVPPFDDERVRQALSYAIQRDRIAHLLGGTLANRITCQVLPSNVQGYAPYCPYTLRPAAGVWSAPNLPLARRLVAEAGARGEHVRVAVAAQGLPAGSVETMRYVTSVLDRLGLHADLETWDDTEAYFTSLLDRGAHQPDRAQVALTAWYPDFAVAGNILLPLFACGDRGGANMSRWCDPRLDRQMEAALASFATQPGEANRAWAAIDRRLVDAAVVVPLSNPVSIYAVSDRVGNVQEHPQWGLLLSRLWVQ